MLKKIKFITTSLLLFLTIGSSAQSLNGLIEQKGYFQFKIGDTYSKWKPNLELIASLENQKSYLYKGKISSDFFSYPVDNVILTFNTNQKLACISIDLATLVSSKQNGDEGFGLSLKEFGKLSKILKSAYGKETHYNSDKDGGTLSYSWLAKEYFLGAKISYISDDESTKVTIDFGDRSFFKI